MARRRWWTGARLLDPGDGEPSPGLSRKCRSRRSARSRRSSVRRWRASALISSGCIVTPGRRQRPVRVLGEKWPSGHEARRAGGPPHRAIRAITAVGQTPRGRCPVSSAQGLTLDSTDQKIRLAERHWRTGRRPSSLPSWFRLSRGTSFIVHLSVVRIVSGAPSGQTFGGAVPIAEESHS